MFNNTSDLATFKRGCIKSLVDFIDNVLAEKDWLFIRDHIDTIQRVNYRVDRQGVSVSPCTCYLTLTFPTNRNC